MLSETRNRTLTDIVAARHATLRLAGIEPLAGLFLLMRGKDRLAAEFNAVGLCVGPAARGTFEDATAFQLCGNTEDRKDDGVAERFAKNCTLTRYADNPLPFITILKGGFEREISGIGHLRQNPCGNVRL